MKTYRIIIELDDPFYAGEVTGDWSGYDEQSAIAQAFLYWAQRGSRELKVLSIEEK